MTAHGLVTRWRSDTDGRAVLLSLTAEAEALMAAVHRRRTETFARAVARPRAEARRGADRRPTRYRTVSKAVLDGAFDPAPD